MVKSIRARGQILATLAAAALAISVLAAFGPLAASSASSNAANKMVAQGSTKVYLCTNKVSPSAFKTCAGTAGKTSKSTVTILSGTVKTSSTVTLVINVAMECSTVTNVSTKGSSTSTAKAGVTVKVEVNGIAVPINPGTGTTGTVTFCTRDLGLSTKNFSTTQIIKITDSTEYANAFNWVDVTVPQGTNTVTLVASLHAHATGGTTTPTLTIEAVAGIGGRTMIVTPAHTANNAQFTTTTL